MRDIKQIAHGGVGGAFIAIVSFVGNITGLGYVVNPFLIPFILIFMKSKKPENSIFVPTVIASILLMPYKYYLVLYLFAYYFIATAVLKVGPKITPIHTLLIGIVYFCAYYGSYATIGMFIYGYDLKRIVTLFTGLSIERRGLITTIFTIEPIAYAMALQMGLEKIKRYRL